MTGPDCDKMTLYHQARLPFGLTLPVTLVTERTVRYAAGETERSPEEPGRRERRSLWRSSARSWRSGTETCCTTALMRCGRGCGWW